MDDDKGKTKKINELYLVHAVSPTDAEAIVTKEKGDVADFKVTSITETKVLEVLSAKS
jgi:hypothetical protein